MILRASLINAQSTVALVKFFVTCVRIRRIIYEILCYPVIYWRAYNIIIQLVWSDDQINLVKRFQSYNFNYTIHSFSIYDLQFLYVNQLFHGSNSSSETC